MTDRVIVIDGVEHHFPAEATDADISAALSKHAPAPAPKGFMVKAFGDNVFGRAMDTFNDATTGAGQGATLGLSDEANAGGAALLRGGKGYDEELANQRKILHDAQERSPVATGVGEAAGSLVALPRAGAAATQSLGRTMLQGSRDAGIYSAAYGFGTGEDGIENRGEGALRGGLTGAAVGAAAPAVIAGTGMLARPLVNTARGIFNPEAEAARQGLSAIRADRLTPSRTMLTDQEFAAGAARGQPVTNLELGGESTAALARKSANLSPTARATLNNTIDERFEGQSDRVGGFVRSLVGGGNAAATREALQAQAVTENAARYRPAMRAGNRLIDSPELARLTNSPDMQAAIRAADPAVTSRTIAEGGGAADIPTTQNLQFWDAVKRRLDAAIAKAERGGDGEAVQRLTLQNQALTAELDHQVPEYAAARAGAATHFGADNALQAGQNFLTHNFNTSARAISGFSPSERRLFAEGFADSLITKIEKTGDRRNVVNAVFSSNEMRDRIRLALGPRRARELEAYLRVESAMDAARAATQGNSTTARQLVEVLGLGGLDNYVEGHSMLDPRGLLIGAGASHFGRHAFHGAQALSNARVSPRIAEMLTSRDPNVFNQGIRLVAHNPRWMQALRSWGSAAGAVAGQNSTGWGK